MALHFPSVEFVAMTVIGVAVSYPDPDHPKSKAICSFDVCPSLCQSLCWIQPEFIAPQNSVGSCRLLQAHPELVRGKRVVELGARFAHFAHGAYAHFICVFMSQMQGAGTGLVGLVCGALGASEVVLHVKWSK